MKLSQSLLFAAFAMAVFAGSAHASVYFTNFQTGFAVGGPVAGIGGWVIDDATPDASRILNIGGAFSSRSASLGYVSPLNNNNVYLSHPASTPLVGNGLSGVNASFSTLFLVVDSDEGYDDPLADPPITGSAARDTFGFRLENASGDNLFSLYLNPWDQDPAPSLDPEFNYLSWSTGTDTPTVVLNSPWKTVAENNGYTFSIQFSPSGVDDVSFVATFNGADSFSGVLPGAADETIGEFGAFWNTLNGAALPGSNFLIFDNVSLVPEPSSVLLGLMGASVALVRRRRA